jgi:hypothetical protein
VRASHPPAGSNLRVARSTFPVFIDTGMDFPLSAPAGVSREQVLAGTVGEGRVPPLSARWTEGDTFVKFLGDTFTQYYKWAVKG